MTQRIVLYLANMIKDQDLSSINYSNMKKTVSIMIAADHNINEDERYFHRYNLRDEKDNSLFTDLIEVNILELKKLPDKYDGSPLWDWLTFIKTNNEETIKMLSEKNPEIEKTYDTLLDISSDEAERHAAQQHEMYLQNEAAINKEKFELGLKEGQRKEKIEIAKSLINANLSVDFISKHTGLPIDDIKGLSNE